MEKAPCKSDWNSETLTPIYWDIIVRDKSQNVQWLKFLARHLSRLFLAKRKLTPLFILSLELGISKSRNQMNVAIQNNVFLKKYFMKNLIHFIIFNCVPKNNLKLFIRFDSNRESIIFFYNFKLLYELKISLTT